MTLNNVLIYYNNLLAISLFLLVGYTIVLLYFRFFSVKNKIIKILNIRYLSFTITLISIFVIIGPLIYQIIFGFHACTLCLYQRMFIWPVALLWFISKLYKNKQIRVHVSMASRWFLLASSSIALYHISGQFGLTSTSTLCNVIGQSISCDGIDVIIWGFLTIPFMSLISSIILFIILSLYIRKSNENISL